MKILHWDKLKKLWVLLILFSCSPKKEEKIKVPDIKGKTIEEVKKSYPYLKISIDSYNPDPKYPKDVIYSQSPPPGALISKKDIVKVHISKGWFPESKSLRFSGKIESINLTKEDVKLALIGSVYNPNPSPVFINYFYFIPYDHFGRRYKTRILEINQWLPPKRKVSKTYKYSISYKELLSTHLKIDSLIVKIVAGCVYQTNEGEKCTQMEFGPKTITGLLKTKK